MADRFDHFGVRVLSSRNDRGQYIRPILLTLFLLSGGGGLIYQVVWMRMLGFAMGSTVLAVSTVLTAFMAGLALGSFSFGRLIDRRADALKVYAYLEIGIGLCGLAMPTLLLELTPIYVGMTRLLSDSYAELSSGALWSVLCAAGGSHDPDGRYPAPFSASSSWHARRCWAGMSGCSTR